MAGINKVILVGNLGRDPEIKYTQANVPVANFSIATSESWKDKTTGEWQENTEWHRIVAWRGLAERVEAKLKKGNTVYIEGRLETRKWEKDGRDHYTTEVIADKLLIFGAVSDGKEREQPQPRAPFTPPPAPAGDIPDDGEDSLPF